MKDRKVDIEDEVVLRKRAKRKALHYKGSLAIDPNDLDPNYEYRKVNMQDAGRVENLMEIGYDWSPKLKRKDGEKSSKFTSYISQLTGESVEQSSRFGSIETWNGGSNGELVGLMRIPKDEWKENQEIKKETRVKLRKSTLSNVAPGQTGDFHSTIDN